MIFLTRIHHYSLPKFLLFFKSFFSNKIINNKIISNIIIFIISRLLVDQFIKPIIRSSKKNLLIISHDTSLTGAPIVALNLAKHFKKKYNTHIFFLHENGSLYKYANKLGISYTVNSFIRHPLFLEYQVKKLKKIFRPDYIIASSVESRYPLRFVDFHSNITTLIHEFPGYLADNIVEDTSHYSDNVVFSSKLQKSLFLQAGVNKTYFENNCSYVIPQGKCSLFSGKNKKSKTTDEISRIKAQNHKNKLILGAGTLQYRKGVDLFCEVAQLINNNNFIFIWIGLYHESDPFYIYIQSQIKLLGLEKRFYIFQPIDDFDEVIKLVDIFLCTSRSDPLPNTVIDAYLLKKPVFLFRRKTGFEDFLTKNQYADIFTSEITNLDNMAKSILNFVKFNKIKKEKIINEIYKQATIAFSFNDYANKIEKIFLNNDFSNVKSSNQNLNYGKKKYLNFNHEAYFYWNKNKLLSSNLYKDYTLKNYPKSKYWTNNLLNLSPNSKEANKDTNVAIHIHVYYIDLLAEILNRINLNLTSADVYISYTNHSLYENIMKLTKRYHINSPQIKLVKNLGRDISHFYCAFGSQLNSYDCIGHFHTKKTPYITNNLSSSWRNFLLNSLLGFKKINSMDQIIAQMSNNHEIGLVAAGDFYATGWSKNIFNIDKFVSKFKLKPIIKDYCLSFPNGSMFWMSSKIYSSMQHKFGRYDIYEPEPLPNDGSFIHFLERYISYDCVNNGNEIWLTSHARFKRD